MSSARWVRSYRASVVLVLAVGQLSFACSGGHGSYPEFGFQAAYEVPCKNPDEECCGLDNCGPKDWPWIDGPHARFEQTRLHELAPQSLQWFESSPDAASWRENPTARLQLIYPSESLRITAQYVPGAEHSWEEQLRNWFERLPPGGEGPLDLGNEQFAWTIDCGDAGRIEGCSSSDAAALGEMKSLLQDPGPSALFEQPSFSLHHLVRRSSHQMDCYSAEVDGVAELDDLPAAVREKQAKYARRD